jgi:hypothetical protein
MKTILFILVSTVCYCQVNVLGLIGKDTVNRPVEPLWKLTKQESGVYLIHKFPYKTIRLFDDKNYFPYLKTDTVKDNKYHIALIGDRLKIVRPIGQNTSDLYVQNDIWALQTTVLDSTLSTYTIVNNSLGYLTYASTNSNGTTKIYNTNLYYYLPKKTPNYNVTVNLPNPAQTNNKDFGILLILNKRCTINFNYPIYFLVNNGEGGLTTPMEFGLSQMNPTLQTIPNYNIKATWFVSKDAHNYTLYIKNNKWFIQ